MYIFISISWRKIQFLIWKWLLELTWALHFCVHNHYNLFQERKLLLIFVLNFILLFALYTFHSKSTTWWIAVFYHLWWEKDLMNFRQVYVKNERIVVVGAVFCSVHISLPLAQLCVQSISCKCIKIKQWCGVITRLSLLTFTSLLIITAII